jgi:PRTRC genetic system protein C
LTIDGQFSVQPPAHRSRRFLYDGEYFDDPGPQYSIREVMGFLAETYPELAGGSWTKTPLADTDVITFYKVTGEKGLTAADLLSALDTIPSGDLPALTLTEQLLRLERAGGLTTDALAKMSADIQAAHRQMRTIETQSAQTLDRVLHLPAAPHPRVPLGF